MTAARAAKDDIEEAAGKLIIDDPSLSDTEAAAKAAAAAAAAALLAAQQAAAKAKLDELASELARREGELAAAEQLAILQGTLAAVAAAEAARVAAEQARAKQLTALEGALNSVYSELIVAQASVAVADKNYVIQRDIVDKEDNDVKILVAKIPPLKTELAANKARIVTLEAEIKTYYAGGYWPWEHDEVEALQAQISQLTYRNSLLTGLIEKFEAQLVIARDELVQAIRIESNVANKAQDTINACNLIIERAETLIGEARLLKILVTLATRVDGLARTVQIKLGELQAKIID